MRVYETVTTDREISIHAPRVEGDDDDAARAVVPGGFLSTPSGWRATGNYSGAASGYGFLSTPSGWRATRSSRTLCSKVCHISIHALRVEGDSQRLCPP